MIHRLVVQLPPLLVELLREPSIEGFGEEIKNDHGEIQLPNDLDLEGVMQILARLQFAYRLLRILNLKPIYHKTLLLKNQCFTLIFSFFPTRLDPVDMAEGRLRGIQSSARITASQMMEIAKSR